VLLSDLTSAGGSKSVQWSQLMMECESTEVMSNIQRASQKGRVTKMRNVKTGFECHDPNQELEGDSIDKVMQMHRPEKPGTRREELDSESKTRGRSHPGKLTAGETSFI
jgi:hypothetical protein